MSSKALTNISADTLKFRYEKALKQIDMLIEVNRQLKVESSEMKESLESAH
jgi:hypothetical protein